MIKRVNINKTRIAVPLILLILVLVFNFCVSCVSAAAGDIIYVNSSGGNDSWNGLSATWTSGINGPKLTIKNALETVNSGGTINIADGTYTGAKNTGITINKNVNIIGQSQTGTIIKGTGKARIFKIQKGVTVTIKNLTVTNGNADDDGGAIYNQGKLTISGAGFTSNYAYISGGAIYNGGTMTVKDSIFTKNIADGGYCDIAYGHRPGATYSTNSNFTGNYGYFAGAAISNDGILTVINSKFINNTAYCSGGVICTSGSLNVVNSNFIDNTAYGSAGAIINWYYSTLKVTGSNFTGNYAYAAGGAIFNMGNLAVTGSSFTNNAAHGEGNPAYVQRVGGAIYNTYGATYIVNSSHFAGNTPQDIYNDTDPYSIYSNEEVGSSDDPDGTVKTASKAITLQKTGLPLAGLAVAILAVFGGLAVPKRE